MALREHLARLLSGTRPPPAQAGEGRLFVSKVDDAEVFAGDLFRRTFGDAVPREPTHYVAFLQTAADAFAAVGYYHVSYQDDYALVGGLCVEPRMRQRGIGEMLERYVYRDAGATKAYFAHVGDATRSRRVGFTPTEHEHLVVCWMTPLAPAEQARLIAQVAALGPF